jgi:hypothetical protein
MGCFDNSTIVSLSDFSNSTIVSLSDFSNSTINCYVISVTYGDAYWVSQAGDNMVTQSGDTLVFSVAL